MRDSAISVLGQSGRKGYLVLMAVLGSLVLPASASALTNYMWTGASTSRSWSDGSNWGGTAPSGSVGTLSFLALTSPACTTPDVCYFGTDDVSGLSTTGISIDDGVGYQINGSDALSIGSGGITATPSASDSSATPNARLAMPLTLSASQTWTVQGGSSDQQLLIAGNVTGGSSALTIAMSDNTFVDVDASAQVGPVSATGSGVVALGNPSASGSLNGTDGNPVSLSGGAGLFADGSDSTIGPLTMSGGRIQVGEAPAPATLAVDGGMSLDSTSSLAMYIDPGTTPSTDYSQITATGAVNLGGAALDLGGGSSSCPTLHVGDVDTLVTTTGSLSGTFSGIANGDTVALNCPGTAPTVTINYTPTSVTATVATAGGSTLSTKTTLGASPSNSVTNQTVTLTATVSASSGSPSGAVDFDNQGMPILGCSNVRAIDGTATCQTSFDAGTESLTASFTPTSGSEFAPSSSPPKPYDVGMDSTNANLGVSNSSPTAGQSVTYTATVTPGNAGSTEPSGSVEFLDGGSPIGSCSAQPLSAGASSSTATCTLSYSSAGSHSITASYAGDGNFTSSTSSPAQTVTVQPAPSPPPSATAPSNTSAPVASGTATEGLALAATSGGWSGTATISYAYQWQRCSATCVDIPGATSSSYTLAPADIGDQILVLVTATNGAGSSTVSSNKLGPVQPSTSEILAALTRVGSPHGKNAKIAMLLKHGYTFKFGAPSAGTLVITWYYLPKGARIAKTVKPVAIARARLSVSAAGTRKVTVRLTSKGKQMLRHDRSLAVTSVAGFTPAGAHATSRKTKFTLRK